MIIFKYENGQPSIESWYKEGDLPVEIYYYDNGQIYRKSWYNLPSEIEYFENGQLEKEIWRKNSKLYRKSDLPAIIMKVDNLG